MKTSTSPVTTQRKKICGECGELKFVSEFSKHKKTSDGLHPYCLQCMRIRIRAWYQRNKAKVKAKVRAWEKVNATHHKAYAKDYNAKYYLKNKGINE